MTRENLIIVKGFYGEGNLGDDILLLNSYKLIRKYFEPNEIIIQIVQPAKYVTSLLGEHPTIILGDVFSDFDLLPSVKAVFIGGGGFLADHFPTLSFFNLAAQFFLRNLGIKPFLYLREFKRRLLKSKKSPEIELRVAAGIEIGPFPLGSKKELASALWLSDFAHVYTRESISFKYGTLWKLKQVRNGSDMAFIDKNLYPIKRTHESRKRLIGVIPRAWVKKEVEELYLDNLIKSLSSLDKKFDIAIFLFQKGRDEQILDKFRKEYKIIEWDPSVQDLESYLSCLSEVDIMLSGRFHGSMIAAQYGIPVISLGISPKLENIQQTLLPHAFTWESPFNCADLQEKIIQIDHFYTTHSTDIRSDATRIFQTAHSMDVEISKILEEFKQTLNA